MMGLVKCRWVRNLLDVLPPVLRALFSRTRIQVTGKDYTDQLLLADEVSELDGYWSWTGRSREHWGWLSQKFCVRCATKMYGMYGKTSDRHYTYKTSYWNNSLSLNPCLNIGTATLDQPKHPPHLGQHLVSMGRSVTKWQVCSAPLQNNASAPSNSWPEAIYLQLFV